MTNILAEALDVGRQAWNDQQARFDQQTRRSAGRALGRGDYRGAAHELYEAGMLNEGAGVDKMQTDAEDRRLGLEKDQRTLEHQKAEEAFSAIKRVSDGLATIGEDDTPETLQQRWNALQNIKPAFGAILPPEVLAMIDSLRPEQLTRAGLIAAGADAENHMKVVSTSSGVVGVTNGKARVLYQDPYQSRLKEAQIGATEALGDQRKGPAGAARAREYRTMHPIVRSGGRSGGKAKSYGADDVNW